MKSTSYILYFILIGLIVSCDYQEWDIPKKDFSGIDIGMGYHFGSDPIISSCPGSRNIKVAFDFDNIGNIEVLDHGIVIGTSPLPTINKLNYRSYGPGLINFNQTFFLPEPIFEGQDHYYRPYIVGALNDTFYGPQKNVTIYRTNQQLSAFADISEGYVAINPHADYNINSYTWEFWMKTSAENFSIISTESWYLYTSGSNGFMSFTKNYNGHSWNIVGGQEIERVNDGFWHHVAISVDEVEDKIDVYLDAVLVMQSIGVIRHEDLMNQDSIFLGKDQIGDIWDLPNRARYDEIRLWNKALNGPEIRQNLFCNLDASEHSELLGYWRMDNSRIDETIRINNCQLSATNSNKFSTIR